MARNSASFDPTEQTGPVAPPRRDFLKLTAALPVAGLPLGATAAPGDSPLTPSGMGTALSGSNYRYLVPQEVSAVQALVARLIPADALGPGAREAGVPLYIDGQLAGIYGQMGRTYRSGPWPPGTPQQGYQSALTPAEVLREGLAGLASHCDSVFGKRIEDLTTTQQDDLLKQMEAGALKFTAVPAQLFFEQLYALTVEGFFADPVYGGNVGKVGWSMVGYPGAAAAYIGAVGQHGVAYRVQPVSLADLHSGRVDNDGLGHAIHQLLPGATS